jgi:titin
VHTISPTLDLPAVDKPVTIDGYTQPGAARNTAATGDNAILRIQIDGSDTASTSGLDLLGAGVVAEGLAINDFASANAVQAFNGAIVRGNFIGTDTSGTLARANGGAGVYALGNAVVGGAVPAARNVISGNGAGVITRGIGVAVLGNLIGTTRNGSSPLGNSYRGIWVQGANARIGGGSGAGNVIAHNGDDGIGIVDDATVTGNKILGNSIYGNGLRGIDLRGDGLFEPNDPVPDADTGSNNLQNSPRIRSATKAGGTTTIRGSIASHRGRGYTIQFFANASGGEAQRFLGQRTVTTDSTGVASFTLSTTGPAFVGNTITATATDAVTGDTSEISPARVLASG